MCLYKKGILVYEESQFFLRKKLISYLLWIKLYHVLNQAFVGPWEEDKQGTIKHKNSNHKNFPISPFFRPQEINKHWVESKETIKESLAYTLYF